MVASLEHRLRAVEKQVDRLLGNVEDIFSRLDILEKVKGKKRKKKEKKVDESHRDNIEE